MEDVFEEDKIFDTIDFTTLPLAKGEYENCNFVNCNFSNTDLSVTKFTECSFTGCNVSSANLHKTALRDIAFKDCKLLGLRFDTCNDMLFSVSFDHCIVNFSSFFKRKLKNAVFKHTSFHETDFTEADLSNSIFDNCDLQGAVFDNTNLEKADFVSSFNYSLDPEMNRIKKAKFSISGAVGLLTKYDIEIEL
jgi:uncharacterized protein YjbI with pentapeptide repeats